MEEVYFEQLGTQWVNFMVSVGSMIFVLVGLNFCLTLLDIFHINHTKRENIFHLNWHRAFFHAQISYPVKVSSHFLSQGMINSSLSKQPTITFYLILGIWMPWDDNLGEHPIIIFRFPKEFYLDLRNLVACTYIRRKNNYL